MDKPETAPLAPRRAYALLAALGLAYTGVYLCRRNLAVAVPLIQQDWGLNKEQVGMVATVSTVAYAMGKVALGPVVDRLGGRRALVAAMALVSVFGAAGAFAPALGLFAAFYSANRLAGSACWGAMVKLTPGWFPERRLAYALGLLSLSYVFGGALAVAFAGWVAQWSHDNWRVVMGAPSIPLAVLVVACARALPRAKAAGAGGDESAGDAPDTRVAPSRDGGWRRLGAQLREMARCRQLYLVCGLSFALTFVREIFNVWIVDFLKTEGDPRLSSGAAALLSTPFDLMGGLGIVAMGWAYGRLSGRGRVRLLVALLSLLAAVLGAAPLLFRAGLVGLTLVVALAGALVYGPYSLLGGVLAVQTRGAESAATVAGLVDGTGYLAGALSGVFFGGLLNAGGYALGFHAMAVCTALAAVLCLGLDRTAGPPRETVAPGALLPSGAGPAAAAASSSALV